MTMIRSMAVMAGYPILILLPVALFAALAWFTRGRVVRWVAIAWAVYGVYETLRFFRILCFGECHERLDLVVIYPLLALASAVGLVGAAVAAAMRALDRRA
jgi:hypothetical protein